MTVSRPRRLTFPRRSDYSGSQAVLLQVAGQGLGETVCDQHARGAAVDDGGEQGGPVGVIGEDETAVEGALAADAADPHQA